MKNPKYQYSSDVRTNENALYPSAVNSPLRFKQADACDDDTDSATADDDSDSDEN